jgi:hypothetical protein
MRKWLQTLVDEYIPAVTPLSHSEDDRAQAIVWAHRMRQQWAQTMAWLISSNSAI